MHIYYTIMVGLIPSTHKRMSDGSKLSLTSRESRPWRLDNLYLGFHIEISSLKHVDRKAELEEPENARTHELATKKLQG